MVRRAHIQWVLVAAGLTLTACGGEMPTEREESEELQLYGGTSNSKINCDAMKTKKKCLATKVCAWEANPGCPAIYPPMPCNPFCFDPQATIDNDCSVVSSDGVVSSGPCPAGGGSGNTGPGTAGGGSSLPVSQTGAQE